MRSVLDRKGMNGQVEVDSAGTLHLHAGNPPDARMTRAAVARGYSMTGRARGLEPTDFTDFDLIVVMDFDNQSEVQSLLANHPHPTCEVRMFCEFCDHSDDKVVPDPYYGGPEGFEKVLDLIEDGCEGIVRWLHTVEGNIHH